MLNTGWKNCSVSQPQNRIPFYNEQVYACYLHKVSSCLCKGHSLQNHSSTGGGKWLIERVEYFSVLTKSVMIK